MFLYVPLCVCVTFMLCYIFVIVFCLADESSDIYELAQELAQGLFEEEGSESVPVSAVSGNDGSPMDIGQ